MDPTELIELTLSCPQCKTKWRIEEAHALPYEARIWCPQCEVAISSVFTPGDIR